MGVWASTLYGVAACVAAMMAVRYVGRKSFLTGFDAMQFNAVLFLVTFRILYLVMLVGFQ
jgi:hypothetical protein